MSNATVPAVVAAEAALVKQSYALIFVGASLRHFEGLQLLMSAVATFIGQILFGIVIAQVRRLSLSVLS